MKANYLNISEKKRRIYSFILLFLLLPTLMIINYNLLGFHTNQDRKNIIINNVQENLCTSNTYQLVDPINISSWNDWANYPFISGNGTSLNPFIIENIEINGTGVKTILSGNDTRLDYTYRGIFVNANGSFIIQNCKISHTSIGIYLYIGISPGTYLIRNIEINNCSIGIYSWWPHVVVNITNCYIHDCNWVSIKAKLDFHDYLDYGGVGIWVRSNTGSTIDNCSIHDCAIGMSTGNVEFIRNNKLINCGIVLSQYWSNYENSNTVNGKPIGLFWGIDNMAFTQANASQYGQLIFVSCNNLTLSNIHITDPSSIGIQLYSLSIEQQTIYLNNVVVENQKLGMYITGRNIIGDNLNIKNSSAGFYFEHIYHSKFTKIMIDNTYIPLYITTPINDVTIQIERFTKFYLVDDMALYGDKLHVESLDKSYNVSMSYIPELGMRGYATQFDDNNIYQLSLVWSYEVRANFTIISGSPYTNPEGEIPGYHLFWLWSIILISFLVMIEFKRKLYQK
ncbi:MAG: right-handed parallel beta-helix repeat-containing protein [Candidatus Odinarchaeota archaeon]